MAAPTGPVHFDISAKPTALEMSRIDPANFAPVIAPASSVTLNKGGYTSMIQSVPVIRQLNLQQITANPRLSLDTAKLDLTPLLTRKGALPMVAQQLQARPNLGVVNHQDVQVSEIKQGLIVRSFLNYQLKPGACTGSNRGQVEALGIRCATRMGVSEAELAAAMADPRNVHYVRDPRERAMVLARAKVDSKSAQAEVMADVANFRASLTSGPGRQALVAQLGQPEIERLGKLRDEDLAAELINSGESKVEHVMFVPRPEVINALPGGQLSRLATLIPASPAAATPKPQPVSTDTPIAPAVYLTGFTLGKTYEWSYTVETTIKWCVLGCKKHYYAHAYANLSYGFGMRFPIKLGGTYHYNGEKQANGQMTNGSATFTPDFAPFQGEIDDYRATGLPEDKLFNGKELVAEAKADAGFDAHIPIYPDPPSLHIEVGKDFTELLPPPFAGGNINPPAKNEDLKVTYTFNNFDLLGGRLNFGIVGAQVFPAVEIGLHSDNVSFHIHDNVAKSDGTFTDISNLQPGQQVTLAVDKDQMSSFTIDKPLYNVSFRVTPGIDARLFVDLGVWGHTWDFPMFFPQLTIEIPKGGVNFACHDGTICSRQWSFRTTNGKTISGPAGALKYTEQWAKDFKEQRQPQCADDACQLGIAFVATGTLLRIQEELGPMDEKISQEQALANPKIAAWENQANALGTKLIQEANARKSGKAGAAWAIIAEIARTKECKDMDCPADIHGIAATMGPRAQQLQTQFPDESGLSITKMVMQEVGPKFNAAIARSQARSGVDSIAIVAQDIYTKQCLDEQCSGNVKLLAGRMSAEARKNLKANPDMSGLELSKSVAPKYGKLFQAEVDASKARAAQNKSNVAPSTPVKPVGSKPITIGAPGGNATKRP